MTKKNIALVAGGDSGEYVISMKSARTIKDHLDKGRYDIYTILINKKKWVCIDDDGNEWPVDKNDFSAHPWGEKITFDCAFITIHGTPGENGQLQAYFELVGLPYTTAGVLPSALTFNKYFCNLVVARLGFHVPGSVYLTGATAQSSESILEKTGLPVFVKPNEGGSSLGMSFVKDAADLQEAIELAFQHDRSVLVEEYLEGQELTCGVFSYNGTTTALPVTEIISKTKARYFDFEAKYTPGAADEITPARIPLALSKLVKDTSVKLYEKLGLAGLVRFDFIHSRKKLFFIEVNVTPGMTETSLVPQAAAVEGISNTELFTMLIEEALNRQRG
ncbi:MAG: D-alanine--D-alanine ligase [Bacteroidales bacterium]|nr:D-alanine--D-alanine ligase [Bacteroidales bacterium]